MSDVQVTYGAPHEAAVETPSEALIKDANRTVIVTDDRGRKLGIKRVTNALSMFRLSRVLGSDAYNGPAIGQALMYASVVSINGDPVPFPKTELQLEALIDRLDMEALALIQKTQRQEFGYGAKPEDETGEAKN
jgi:hypothetical protein